MGKEWYHLRIGIKGKSSSSSSSSSNSKKSTSRRGTSDGNNDASSSTSTSSASANAAGCISAVFQLFDFHQFRIPLHHQTSFADETGTNTNAASASIILKGIEAPRNSLELGHYSPLPSPSTKESTRRDQHIPLHSSSFCDDVSAAVVNISSKNGNNNNTTTFIMPSSSSDIIRKDQHLLTPAMGIGQIKTSRDKNFNASSSSSDIASSPGLGTRTPTLVARLMGLDLLPDSASSSPRSSSTLDAPAPAPVRRQSVHSSRTPQHHRYSSISARKSCSDVDNRTCRSLPDTPKMTLARRSDVDHHHHHRHLSLSLRNKENVAAGNQNGAEEFDFSRFKKELKCSSENGTARSPNHYARQIVKQVKESISKKVRAGMTDITNTMSTRSSEEITTNKDQLPKLKQPPRSSRVSLDVTDDSSMLSSPRLRVLEETTDRTQIPHLPGDAMRTTNVKLQCYDTAQEKLSCQKIRSKSRNDERASTTSTSSVSSGMLASAVGRGRGRGMRSKQLEEPFVRASKGASGMSTRSCSLHRITIDRKPKTSASSCGVRKLSVGGPTAGAGAAPVLLPVRKDPSPPATKIPQKLVHEGQISRTVVSQAQAKLSVFQAKDMTTGKLNTATMMVSRGAELLYASEILRSVGLERITRLSSFTGWRSPSHPLDPCIFDGLETIFFSGGASSSTGGISWFQSMNLLSDRKLVFELVDELLADILKPYWKLKTWNTDHINANGLIYGWELMDKVKARIERYPRAKCEVLEDIDMIIDKDLTRSEVKTQRTFDEEGDKHSLASELERRIWDDLVREEVVCLNSNNKNKL